MQVGNGPIGAVRMWVALMMIVVIVAVIAHWLFGYLGDARWSSILAAIGDVQRLFSIHG